MQLYFKSKGHNIETIEIENPPDFMGRVEKNCTRSKESETLAVHVSLYIGACRWWCDHWTTAPLDAEPNGERVYPRVHGLHT